MFTIKTAAVIFLSLCYLPAIGQTATSEKQFTISDSTGFGTPEGKLISKDIGVAGGRIASEDGRVELIFPAGALTATTSISVQAATNLAPNGVGKAYRFEPSGIHFKKPVHIIFRYTEEEAETCPPDWMSLGMQDHTGKWTFTDYEGFDSIAKTLKGFIHHFSIATNVNDIALKPRSYSVGVNNTVKIDVLDISSPSDQAMRITPTPSGFDGAFIENNYTIKWYANTVLNGNDKTGTITVHSTPMRDVSWLSVYYKAPQVMPQHNPVVIWAEVYRKNKKGKSLKRVISTKVEVYDAYEVKVMHEFTGREGMNAKLTDEASFLVFVYSWRVEVTKIKNNPPKVLEEGRNGPFREKFIMDGALGTIHIVEGVKSTKISKDHPPEVYFEFTPLTVLICKNQYSAKGIVSETVPIFARSIPEEINFIANGQPQTYTIYMGGRDKYKMIVTPYRADK